MSVVYTMTAQITPAEDKGRNWYYFVAKGTATGDGSAGVVDGTLDLAPYIRAGDLVWFDGCNFANESATTNKHAVQLDQQSWSSLKAPSGVLSTIFVGDQTANLYDATYTGLMYYPDRPYHIGRCLVDSSNTLYIKSGANTNGKGYRCWVRFLVFRPQ